MKTLNLKNMILVISLALLNQHCLTTHSDNSNPTPATPSQQPTTTQSESAQQTNTTSQTTLTTQSSQTVQATPAPSPIPTVKPWTIRVRNFVINGSGDTFDTDYFLPMNQVPYFAARSEFNFLSLLNQNNESDHFLKSIPVAIKNNDPQSTNSFGYNSQQYNYTCIQTHLEVVDADGKPVSISGLARVQAMIKLVDQSGADITTNQELFISHSNDCSVTPTFEESMTGVSLFNRSFSFEPSWNSMEPILANPNMWKTRKAYVQISMKINTDSGDQGIQKGYVYSFPLIIQNY